VDRWQVAKQLFEDVVAIPKSQQEEYLAKACSNDDALYHTVYSMLQANDKVSDFSYSGLISDNATATLKQSEVLAPGTLIGSYRILNKLADGGMGSVYHGCRADDSFDKQVAIKLLNARIKSPEVMQVFKQERQILANLNHPNIAHLLDGGATQNGIPFIVMEYVNGKPILEHLTQHQLSINKVMQLFLQICDAVDYAHRNLVIHRDIKAENVLVTDQGKIKLLDFGIASIEDEDTSLDVVGMTPYSASPEQINNESITTASDIYSLAILFYRMLSARNVYGDDIIALDELKKAITGLSPAPISEKTTRKDFKNKLKGDVDAILAKALQKRPEQRYATVASFAHDIRCFLRKLPVSARPQTPLYVLQKLSQRFPKTTIASIGMLMAFFVTILVYTSAINQQKDLAEQRLETSEQVSQFLVGVFEVSDPIESLGNRVTARQILDQGSQTIESTLTHQPEVMFELIHTLAKVYLSLGIFSRSQTLLTQEREYLIEQANPAQKLIRNTLVFARLRGIQGDIDEQDKLLKQAFDLQQTKTGDESVALAEIAMKKAAVLQTKGELDEALVLHSTYYKILQGQLAEDSDQIISARLLKNLLYFEAGNYDEAVKGAASLHPMIVSRFGTVHPKTADNLSDWGYYAEHTGDMQTAKSLLLQALDIDTQIYGESHPVVMADLLDLGSAMSFIDTQEASGYLRQVIEMGQGTLSENHPSVALAHNDLASIYLNNIELAKAEFHYLESLRINRIVYGDKHPDIATNLSNLGVVYVKSNQLEKAKRTLFEALAQRQQIMGESHPHVAASLSVIGNYYISMQDFPSALTYYTHALEMKRLFHDNASEMILTARARVMRTHLYMQNMSMATQEFEMISADIASSEFIFEGSQAYLAGTFALYVETAKSCEQKLTVAQRSSEVLTSYKDFNQELLTPIELKTTSCQ
jgi:serine/threonine-protein kinase